MPVAEWTIYLESGNVLISTDTAEITEAFRSSSISTNATRLSGNMPTSVGTICDFSEADNNGTVQCINLQNRNEATPVMEGGEHGTYNSRSRNIMCGRYYIHADVHTRVNLTCMQSYTHCQHFAALSMKISYSLYTVLCSVTCP